MSATLLKKCPQCNRTYSDVTISFCLEDGAVLSPPYDPNATEKLPQTFVTAETEQRTERIPAPPTLPSLETQSEREKDSIRTITSPVRVVQETEARSVTAQPVNNRKYILLSVILTAFIIGGGVWFLTRFNQTNTETNSSTPIQTNVENRPTSSNENKKNNNENKSPTRNENKTPTQPNGNTQGKNQTEEPKPSPTETPEPKKESLLIGGTYSLYDRKTKKYAGQMTVDVRSENEFYVYGEGWSGKGRVKGNTGYYDWRFKDGKTGRTTFVIGSGGAWQGHVNGSGLNWRYVARRNSG